MKALARGALVYAALAVAMTWPLAARLGIVVPIGGDNLHLAWVLAWIAHALTSDPLSLFDGNIFHPVSGSIALSDPNVSSALLVAPAWWATGNPALLVNLLFLSSFVLCGVAAQALAREWGATPLAAFAAGLFFAFSPLRFTHVDHVQLYAFWWTPLALLAFDRFLREGGIVSLGIGTGCLVLQAYASIYLAAFAGAAVAVLVVVALASGRMRIGWSKAFGGAAATAIAGALLCVPLALAYGDVRTRWGAARTLEQNVRYSASPLAYLSSAPGSLLWGGALERFADPVAPWEKQLFPGLALTTLALFAVLRDRRDWRVRFGLALAALGAVCSLGPYLVWRGASTGIPLPYLAAWEWFPLLQGLRGPARWALLATLGLALAGSAAVARLSRPVACVLLAFSVLEAWVVPLPTTPAASRGGPLDEWLASGSDGAVLELPLAASIKQEYEREPMRVYRSTFHWRSIVNGYSGYTPPPYRALRQLLASKPPDRVLPVLASWDVRTIVLHTDEMTPADRARWEALADRGLARRAFAEGAAIALVLDHRVPPMRRPAARPATKRALRAGETSAVPITLGGGDSPIGLPPESFGWHRARARWTRADGSSVERRAKYECPPIVHRRLPPRTVFLDAPSSPGTYRVRLEGACYDFEATFEVAGAP